MKKTNPMDTVHVMAKLADLSEVDYRNTLVISAVIELLVEKGLMTRKDVLSKAKELDIHFTQLPTSLDDLGMYHKSSDFPQ